MSAGPREFIQSEWHLTAPHLQRVVHLGRWMFSMVGSGGGSLLAWGVLSRARAGAAPEATPLMLEAYYLTRSRTNIDHFQSSRVAWLLLTGVS